MTQCFIHEAQRTLAPEGWTRDRAIAPSGLSPESKERYDFDTLFYEAVRVGRNLVIVAPKLLNFRTLFRKTVFEIDGQRLPRPSIASYYRHALIRFRNVPEGNTLRLIFPGGEETTAQITSASRDHLKGLNCEFVINKNNDLRWIREKLIFHCKHRGVEAVLLIDTGSTEYSLEDLATVLTSVGLKRAVIVSMPYKWGGLNKRPVHRELYLQTASFNLCRIKYLQSARAVLCMDIDEIISHVDGPDDIFDLTCKSRLGFTVFSGTNRYPRQDATPPFQFADHELVNPGDSGSDNWCVNPRGPMGGFQWRCHNLERNILSNYQRTNKVSYLHCLGLTTGWHGRDSDRWASASDHVLDESAREFWQTDFLPALSENNPVH